MTPSQATTRPKVRATISSDYVTIVLQTLSETSTIRPEVASLLANDAEYYLRHLINLSKHHMRHAKRSRLSVSDVQLAAKRSPGALPGFGISSSAPVPNFQPIPSCHGLFVTSDIVVPLVDVLHRPLPLPPRPTDLFPSGLIIPYANLNILSQLSQQNGFDPAVQSVVSMLSSKPKGPQFVESTLVNLNTSAVLPLQQIVNLLRNCVDENARQNGNSIVLLHAMRVSIAIITRRNHGIEIFEDALLPAILTCLLAPHLGESDAFSVRLMAAEALQAFLMQVNDPFLHQRVCNTLLECLTDSSASLPCLTGAVSGLAVMGEHVFVPVFMPLLPALIDGVQVVLESVRTVGVKLGGSFECDAVRLCQAVERGMRMCRLTDVESDAAFIDIVL